MGFGLRRPTKSQTHPKRAGTATMRAAGRLDQNPQLQALRGEAPAAEDSLKSWCPRFESGSRHRTKCLQTGTFDSSIRFAGFERQRATKVREVLNEVLNPDRASRRTCWCCPRGSSLGLTANAALPSARSRCRHPSAGITLAVLIAAVGDVRCCGEGPDRRRADSLFTLSAVSA
jgi:hypothetical protein